MGLRARLALYFVAITVVPLTVAVVVLQVQLTRRVEVLAQREVNAAGSAAGLALGAVRQRASDLATDLATTRIPALLANSNEAAAQAVIDASAQAVEGRVDLLLVVDADGKLFASHVGPAQRPGATVPRRRALARAVSEGVTLPGAVLEIREIQNTPPGEPAQLLGWVAAGFWADEELLDGVPVTGGAALIAGSEVLAVRGATTEDLAAVELPAAGEVVATQVAGEEADAIVVPVGGSQAADAPKLLVWQERAGPLRLLRPILLLLLLAVALAALVGWALAGGVVAPVRRAAEVARSVAAGDLDQTLEPTGGRELADLAGALNSMSAELQERLQQLEAGRDQLRQSLSRLGQTLSSSLDLDRTLAVVVETAIETLGADRGMLWLFTPERDALYVKVGRRIGGDVLRLPVGTGVAGHVARVGVALRLPADAGNVGQPSPDEPSAAHQLAVPMVGRGRVLGVLSLLSDDPARPFTQDDLDTLRSFGAQASVAMENVMLHQEAQRLSVTDPLTGLWNFRYFQLQADRELESAARFERPLSLLIIDLDHFKTVNDRFGHQVGDDVLVEVARRIQAATRVPDVVARYGGEEFVVLLPGTDAPGAVATAERIRVAVSASRIVITTAQDIAPMAVTCSIGVSEHPVHGTTVAGLLRSADAAMYQAKAQGRDRVVAAGSGSTTPSGRLGGVSGRIS